MYCTKFAVIFTPHSTVSSIICYFILRSKKPLISSVGVLPSGCVISYYMLDTQMYLFITDNAVRLSCKNTANNAFLNVVHWYYQGVLYFLNAIWCHGNCECNYVHPHKEITSFPSPTLTKLTSAQQHGVYVPCNESALISKTKRLRIKIDLCPKSVHWFTCAKLY
jgi:hypothetical protein